eukprot:Skav231458  [mRNA]  locus=scaffold1847:895291:895632:- [translate_table: standard]
MQRKIMQGLTTQQSAALILDFVRSRLLQMDVPGKQVLMDCLEDEASRQHMPPPISQVDLRRLRKTLSRMNAHKLLAVFTSRASKYSQEDRVRAEFVFTLVQSVHDQLLLMSNK